MIAARILCENHTALWGLAAHCQPFLGPAGGLTILAEDAVTSMLAPWTPGVTGAWTLGRIFGARGELHWRAYGACVRALLITDGLPPAAGAPTPEAAAARLQTLGFAEVSEPALTASPPQSVPLWRNDAYREVQVQRYVDNAGVEQFVRYVSVTPK